jgi:hypothetical protein
MTYAYSDRKTCIHFAEYALGLGKIALQGANLKVSAQIGADALRGCHGT